MALDLAKLKSDLKGIKNLANNNGELNTDAALELMAVAIDAFVKSGRVIGNTSGGHGVNLPVQ